MIIWLLVTSICLGADDAIAAPVGPGDEYRVNWARAAQGASVVESTEIHPVTDVRNLLGARLGKGEGNQNGTTIFADRVRQRERFVIDLGRERLIGRVFVGSHAPEGKRHPGSVAIRGSRKSPRGPWQTLVADGDMPRQHTFLFDNTPARYLEVDFGECTDGWGTRVSSFGAFTRYRCPESHEVARWLAALLDRDAEELQPFFAAADADRWDDAVSALRDVYVNPHFWPVRDDMLTDGDHRFEQRWHLPENADPKELEERAVATQFAEGGNLLLKPVTETAESSVKQYQIAYKWDECVPAKSWCYVPDGRHIVTLLVPYRGIAAPSSASGSPPTART